MRRSQKIFEKSAKKFYEICYSSLYFGIDLCKESLETNVLVLVQHSFSRAAAAWHFSVVCVSPLVRACKRCSSTMTENFLAILAIIVGSVKTPVNDGRSGVRSGGKFSLYSCFADNRGYHCSSAILLTWINRWLWLWKRFMQAKCKHPI